MPANFHQVDSGVYRGAIPSERDLKILKEVFKVKRIVSLDEGAGNNIAPFIKQLGLEHIIIPIHGRESKGNVDYLKNNISQIIVPGTYIHCKHGADRSGMVIAFYRILHDGWVPEKAIQEALQIGFGQTGIDPDTKQFYLNEIKSLKPEDNNKLIDTDIVQEVKDYGGYNDISPIADPQHSWALREDIPAVPPQDKPYTTPGDKMDPLLGDPNYLWSPYEKHERNTYRQNRLKDMVEQLYTTIPEIGIDYHVPGYGVGPISFSGGILNI